MCLFELSDWDLVGKRVVSVEFGVDCYMGIVSEVCSGIFVVFGVWLVAAWDI